jgi:prolyl-tRNA synthetase
MKDMYHFSATETENLAFYESVIGAYMKVYQRMGLGETTFVTSASGGVFTDKFSHEFQTLSEAGEDIIYINAERKLALNEEVFNEKTLSGLGLKEADFEKKKAIEVGNIFNFGTGKSEQLGLYVSDEGGERVPAQLSSYGIGITRLMGTIVEALSDEKGIIWPKEVAPFRVHLIAIGEKATEAASEIYKTLEAEGVEVLFDDRDVRAGEKFADADLIGIPTRVVLGEKSLESRMLEVKDRGSDEVRMLTLEHLIDELLSTKLKASN